MLDVNYFSSDAKAKILRTSIQIFSSVSNKPFIRFLYFVISESSCNFHYLSLSVFAKRKTKFSDVSFLIETTICPGYARLKDIVNSTKQDGARMMGGSMSERETTYKAKSTSERWRDLEWIRQSETKGKGRRREGGSEIAFNPARFNTSDKFCRRIN